MRIRILSDLHGEFGLLKLPEVAADLVVLAGDIDRGTKSVAEARQAFPDVPALYVAGNHEHCDERVGRLHEKLKKADADLNVHILENETFEVDGQRFFGATLWTDFCLFDDPQSAMLMSRALHRDLITGAFPSLNNSRGLFAAARFESAKGGVGAFALTGAAKAAWINGQLLKPGATSTVAFKQGSNVLVLHLIENALPEELKLSSGDVTFLAN